MKMCAKDREEKMKRSSTKSPSKWMMKKCSTKLKSVRSWADLDLDLFGEIKKKLYYGDHARFSGVCKSWLAAQHEKRTADVLPMVMLLCKRWEDDNEISYDLYEPLNMHKPVISRMIDLNQFFDTSGFDSSKSIHYREGYLFLSMISKDFSCTDFLIVSILTNKSYLAIPRFYHPRGFPSHPSFKYLKAFSTYPADPDCVFLALLVDNDQHWYIGIFRHGDAQWTATEFYFQHPFGKPCLDYCVFIGGVFYFLCYGQRLVSYDIASGKLKFDYFSAPVDKRSIEKFFGLDGKLMLMYYDHKVNKYFLKSYDWPRKLWVPLKNLGGRSLFLSRYSVYLDNYGVSPNKIYVHSRYEDCCVYSLENGELKSSSSGLKYWSDLYHPRAVWVAPCDLLPKKGTIQQKMKKGGYNGRWPIKEFAQ